MQTHAAHTHIHTYIHKCNVCKQVETYRHVYSDHASRNTKFRIGCPVRPQAKGSEIERQTRSPRPGTERHEERPLANGSLVISCKPHGHPSMTARHATPPGGALGLERAPFTDRPRVWAVSLCLFNLSGRRKARPPDRPYTPETQHSLGTVSC